MMNRIKVLLVVFSIIAISGLTAQTVSKSSSFSFEDAAVILPSPKSVSLDASGRLGERFYGNIDFLHERYDNYGEMMINAFAERKYVPGYFLELVWEREYGGKWLDAAVRAGINTNDFSLLSKADHFAASILKSQNPDGYMGVKLPTDRDLNLWEQQWDLWGQWYAMVGFLSYYEFRGGKEFLEAATKTADWVIKNFGPIKDKNARFLTVGDLDGGTNVAIIGQFIRLYRHTGNEALIDFVSQVIQYYAPIQKMISSGEPVLTHPYMLCAYLGGVTEYAQVTKNKETLAWVEKIWDRMVKDHLYPTGSLGEGEKLHPGELKDVAEAHFQETCATTEWMFFTQSLYQVTGRAKYLEMLEKTIFNALLAAQSQNGMKWCYFTPLRYHKDWFHGPTNCCYWSGPRGIVRIPQLIYAVNKNNIHVNFFEPSKAKLLTDGGEVSIIQKSEFPEFGRSKIIIDKPAEWTGKLRLRIPSWTTEFQVYFEGKLVPNITDDNGYYDINLTKSPKHEIEVHFDIPIVRELFTETKEEFKKYLEPGSENNFLEYGSFKIYLSGYIFKRGPEVLSIDVRDVDQANLDWIFLQPEMNLQPAEPDKGRRRYEATFNYMSSPDQPRNFMFTPYADAGNDGAKFKTVYPVAEKLK
jgi:DUF1680 family protein